ncbi:MAG TPA: beta-phosphoglucomutase [Bacillota bacterium]|nr:beta-phosphoglucomutase [Bacillota bacterium]
MNRNYNAILVDLNGVVVNTDKYHYRAWKKLTDEMGFSFHEDLNHQLRGVSRLDSLQIILDFNRIVLPEDEKEALVARKNNYYQEFLGNIGKSDLYPGAIRFIQQLKDRGIKTALCSSSRNATLVIVALGLANLFDAIVTGNDIGRGKPDPEIFQLAAKRLEVHPLNCIVFEDAVAGLQAAAAAGMRSVGVGPKENLPEAEETFIDYDEIDIEELLESGRKKRILIDPWRIVETEINPKRSTYWESLFALCNGYLGIRGTYDEEHPEILPWSRQGMYINGIYDYMKSWQYVCNFKGLPERIHTMLNLWDWTIINLEIEDERFNFFSGKISQYRRELNMQDGVLHRSLLWESPKGKKLKIESYRIVSMVRRHSAVVHYEVTPINFSGAVTFESALQEKAINADYSFEPLSKLASGFVGGFYYSLFETQNTHFRVSMGVGHRLSKNDAIVNTGLNAGSVKIRMTVSVAVGESVSLDKHACFFTSMEENIENLIAVALDAARKDTDDGFQRITSEQSLFWRGHWDTSDIEIGNNDGDQQALRFNMFQLRQNHPEDDRLSISATGLTGNHYGGLVFWDTEMYMIPYFNYIDPKLVKHLLMYRYSILERARERAFQLDGVGALFSWMSINGEETNALPECSTAQYHINSDIAYAIWRYYISTGDQEFLFHYGAEILFETARFLADRGKFIPYRDERFCLNCVCGPDEYGCAVNNNCYTNMMAQFHFNFAVRVYEMMVQEVPQLLAFLSKKIALKSQEPKLWRQAADQMYIKFNHELGIHEQDDSYLYRDPVDMRKIPRNFDIRYGLFQMNLWRMQITKQADVVLLMFVLGDKFSLDVKKANYEFYEPRTCHGSSLSPSIHSIIASEIGRPEEAYDFFHQSLYMDISDFRQNTAGGVHFASAGGTWMAVVNGFAGMRDYEEELLFKPHLPKQWAYFRFKLLYRGRLLEILVEKDRSSFTLSSGEPLSFRVCAQTVELNAINQTVTIGV